MKAKKMVKMSIALLMPLILSSYAGAQPYPCPVEQFVLKKVADLNTKISGEYFTAFRGFDISGNNVAFRGLGSWNDGIYLFENGRTLGRVADKNTRMPNSAVGEQFLRFDSPKISGERVAFTGHGFAGGQGVYYFDGLRVNRIADLSTPVPGKTVPFDNFSSSAISADNVVFKGSDVSSDGIYLFDGTSKTLQTVADFTTPMPPLNTDLFTFFYSPVISGSDIAFHGGGTSSQGAFLYQGTSKLLSLVSGTHTIDEGVVRISDGNVAFLTDNRWSIYLYYDDGTTATEFTVVDSTILIPNGGGERFQGSVDSCDAFAISGSKVAFLGIGQVARLGIYLFDAAQSSWITVADNNTQIPGALGTFDGFWGPAIDGDNVVFWGRGSSGHNGIYSFDITTQTLCAVADSNTDIPNGSGTFTSFDLNPLISEKNVVFSGGGSSGQQGVYLALAAPNLTVTTINYTPAQPSAADNVVVDWEVINNGPVSTGSGFYSYLFVDGVYKTYRQHPVLDPGQSHPISGVNIGKLAVGAHDIKVWVDYRNKIAESDEGDNEAPTKITVGEAPLPDLGVLGPIQVKNQGNAGSPFTTNDDLNVSYTVQNTGSVATSAGFYDYLYVVDAATGKETYKANKYHAPLNAGSSDPVASLPIKKLPAGKYKVKIVVDSGNKIAETNNNNNVDYSAEFDVLGQAQPKPDLTVSANISIRNKQRTTPLLSTDYLYVTWTIQNVGAGAASGVVSELWVIDSNGVRTYKNSREHGSLNAGASSTTEDREIGMLPAGTNFIEIIVDPKSRIDESYEDNNRRIVGVTIDSPPQPDLTCYQDDGTTPNIVVKGPGNSLGPFSSTDDLTVDWTVKNIGAGAASSGFVSELWIIDSNGKATFKTSREHGSLNAGASSITSGRQIGRLPVGTNFIEIRVDPKNRVGEGLPSGEGNNTCRKQIDIQ